MKKGKKGGGVLSTSVQEITRFPQPRILVGLQWLTEEMAGGKTLQKGGGRGSSAKKLLVVDRSGA